MSRLVGVLTALTALVVFAAPAQATFPGRNGGIAYGQHTGSGDLDPQMTDHARLKVALPPPGRNPRTRTLLDCVTSDGVPTSGDCTGTHYGAPSYSPDGERIVFEAGNRIAIMDADGGQVALQPAATADDGDPCFSPDGKRIALTGPNDHGGTDIYVRALAGGAARMIVRDAAEPAWSSRGRLAYVREGKVYTANSTGHARRLVGSGISPDWSPNGRRLAVVRPLPTATFGRLYTVSASGRDLRRVGRSKNTSHPVWSPDGRWLAYYGFDLGVHVKRVGSSAQAKEIAPTQISGESGSVASFDPAWRPR
jgi:Tol biopolymer transport system component